jgi:hypothetical protein
MHPLLTPAKITWSECHAPRCSHQDPLNKHSLGSRVAGRLFGSLCASRYWGRRQRCEDLPGRFIIITDAVEGTWCPWDLLPLLASAASFEIEPGAFKQACMQVGSPHGEECKVSGESQAAEHIGTRASCRERGEECPHLSDSSEIYESNLGAQPQYRTLTSPSLREMARARYQALYSVLKTCITANGRKITCSSLSPSSTPRHYPALTMHSSARYRNSP